MSFETFKSFSPITILNITDSIIKPTQTRQGQWRTDCENISSISPNGSTEIFYQSNTEDWSMSPTETADYASTEVADFVLDKWNAFETK